MQRYGRNQRRVEDEEEEDENIALDEEDDDMADENDGENVRGQQTVKPKKKLNTQIGREKTRD